ncbi:MAG: leucine-rich repeat domain-containing protein [Muribaculaceae bacterium]|nr:leucine-rich repeat domain-containing protein [Muribaculaceae bacterium]
MKSTLLKKVERFRHLAILLLAVCGYATADAQLSSDEINEAILVEGSVPVKWTNDAEHPWYIATDESGSYMCTPETEADHNFTSTLSFEFSSTYPVEISFTWRRYWYNEDSLTVIVDGTEQFVSRSDSWTTENTPFIIPAGEHQVQIQSNNGWDGYNSSYWAGIRNLRVWECKELETACLKKGSLPITFENDPEHMWITENGYIRSTTQFEEGEATSKISTTFTIDKVSLFSLEVRDRRSYYYDYSTRIYIDGIIYNNYAWDGWSYVSVVLYPGSHTVEIENWQANHYEDYNITEIRNVCLDQNWYEVTLNNPGELGVKILQALEGKNLQDAELVKINGAMNSDDWAIVKQLSGAKAFDLTAANITSIPDEGMRGLSYLSTVMLPSTLKKIGNYAFYETNFHQIEIPASVEEIGWRAWNHTPLQFINFASGSNLRKIGHCAFESTRIMEFIMPDSVTETTRSGDEHNGGYWYEDYNDEWNVVASCESLKKLHISEGLDIVPRGTAYNCTALEEVNIPVNAEVIERESFSYTNIKSIDIPETVTKIAYRAFAESALESLSIPPAVETYGGRFAEDCKSLKEVSLSSHCWDMYAEFSGCTALEKIVLPCATPPSVNTYYDYEPFYNVIKSNVTLYVPDFALEAYKADPYWYQFTNTQVSDEASVNDYWAIRGDLTLNNAHHMQGTPSLEIMTGGTLTLDADTPQSFDVLTFNNRESSPASLLSRTNSVNANRVVTNFYVDERDRWYFFSPVTDVNMADVRYPATDSWVIRYYDGARRASEDATSGNWINVPADGTLKSGQGYIIQAREPGWLYMPAAATSENEKVLGSNAVTFDLADNACETEANAGWNFVANPYPTYYDIYYIDMQAPITIWDGSTYRAYSLNDGDRGDDTFVLRPMQPFFVQKSAADLQTGMPLVGRQINTTIDRSRAPRPIVKDENRQKLNLELYCNDNENADDYTRVVLNEQASMAYETVRDASKFMSMDAKVAQLYTLGNDKHPMAINERPYEDGNVALGVLLPATDRTYRISAQRADRQAWLYDAETGIEFDLTEGDYIFSASKTGIDNSRFSIRFAPAVTAVEGVEANAVKVAGNTGSISVSAPAGATVAVFGTDGSIITNTVAENGSLEISVAGGVYVVKVNGESFKTIVK